MNQKRIRSINPKPLRHDGDYVLYWMTAYRRTRWNHSLDRAVEHATALSKPLVVLEALRAGYRWASDRLHRFVIGGMVDNDAACARAGVTYHPYIEPRPGDGAGLLETLARRAAVVVTDDFPCFFLPRMIEAAGGKLDALGVGLEAVDGRDPNSYSGIFWVLGRYDRAWGPERPVFGKVRYMSSDNNRRKLRLGNYLETFGAASPQPSLPGS